jgi:hypothetical protein
MIFLGAVLLGAPASGQPSPDRERAQSLPPDWLAVGALADPDGVIRRAGDLLSRLSGAPAGASLRAQLGSLIRNPDLAGVDLSQPVRFFYMNPRLFPRPWVCQFSVADAEALRKALAANKPAAQEGEIALHLEGRQAIWSLDAKAGESLIRWQKGGGKPPDFRAAGRFQARLDVQGLLRAQDAEFAAQVLLMRGRVREALQRDGRKGAAVEKEISDVQAQLDSAVAALRQVQDADFALDFTPKFARAEADLRLADSAPLRALFRAQAPGDLGLLGLCPSDASLVVVNNLWFANDAGRMLLNMAGWASPKNSEPGAGAGGRAIALFLSPQSGEPSAPTRVEILDLRDGDQATAAREEWDRLARQASEGAPAAGEPTPEAGKPTIPDESQAELFSLRPVNVQGPAPPGVRLAEVVPNEAALGPNGLAVFRRFLGTRVQAAQERRGDICITAIGGAPLERLRQADALVEAKQDSLPASARFRGSVASLPEKPNLLVYVSADALRRWFALAGRAASGPVPADAMGLAAGLTIDGDGARFILSFPILPLQRGDAAEGVRPVPANPGDQGAGGAGAARRHLHHRHRRRSAGTSGRS